jgi:putative heme-binding domain-containing protein
VTLDRKETASLVESLRSPNGWIRDTAQRLLIETNDKATVPVLRQLVRSTVNQGPTPLHALWILQQMGELDDATLLIVMKADDSRLVEATLKLCETRAFTNGLARGVADAVNQASAASPPNKAVLRQAAVVLGNASSRERDIGLARSALAAGTDPWVMLAVLGGLRETIAPFLASLAVNEPQWLENPDRLDLARRLGLLVGSRDNVADAAAAWGALGNATESNPGFGRVAFLAGYAEGLHRRGVTLAAVLQSPPMELEGVATGLRRLVDVAEATLDSASASTPEQVTALRLLVEARPTVAATRVVALLNTDAISPLQTTAAELIGRFNRADVAGQVLAGWGRLAVDVRSVLLAAVSQSPQLASALLDAIEREVIRPGELDPATRDTLRQLRDEELQKRLARVLGTVDTDRTAVVQRYLGEIGPRGDSGKGAAVFARNCLNCHQLQGRGFAVGPNLGSVAGRARDALVDDILNPSREVSPDFRNFVVVTHSGRVTNGLFVSENAAGVTLRNPGGTETTTSRADIEAFFATDKSLMPEGLESQISPEELSDLIEFLQRGGTSPLP